MVAKKISAISSSPFKEDERILKLVYFGEGDLVKFFRRGPTKVVVHVYVKGKLRLRSSFLTNAGRILNNEDFLSRAKSAYDEACNQLS